MDKRLSNSRPGAAQLAQVLERQDARRQQCREGADEDDLASVAERNVEDHEEVWKAQDLEQRGHRPAGRLEPDVEVEPRERRDELDGVVRPLGRSDRIKHDQSDKAANAWDGRFEGLQRKKQR